VSLSRRHILALAVIVAAASLCASAGAGARGVGFSGLPSQVYEGQTTTFTLDLTSIASVNCTLTIRYTGKRVDRFTHPSRGGHASWRVRIPAVTPGPAKLTATCVGVGTATGQVIVEWALQTPQLSVTKRGFIESFDSSSNGVVSYGLAIRNDRVRFDATSVEFLVNLVDGANRVLDTEHVGIVRIPAGVTVYRGALVRLPYGQSDPVTRLEIVLVKATSSPRVLSTPVLISDIQMVPTGDKIPGIDSVRGQLLNQSKYHLQGADLGIIILDAAGNVLGGGTTSGGGPLSQGSREFFSSCCSFGKIPIANAVTVLVSAVPSYDTSKS
jgi:hypothetical protein